VMRPHPFTLSCHFIAPEAPKAYDGPPRVLQLCRSINREYDYGRLSVDGPSILALRRFISWLQHMPYFHNCWLWAQSMHFFRHNVTSNP
jgi:hypothetical protein